MSNSVLRLLHAEMAKFILCEKQIFRGLNEPWKDKPREQKKFLPCH